MMIFSVPILLYVIFFIDVCTALKVGDRCEEMPDFCDTGAYCGFCSANGQHEYRCVQYQPVNPFSKVKGLPFNRYTWLTTHNAFAKSYGTTPAGFHVWARPCQHNSVTEQLKHGVRGLTIRAYDWDNDIWLCNPKDETCANYTGYAATYILKEVAEFLEANPTEIVTVFIEDHITSPAGLSKVFSAAGLSKFWFPVSQMPKNGGDWPSVSDMVRKNQRLVVFTSNYSKESTEGIAHVWTYVVENQYGMVEGTCPNRAESRAMNATSRSLILMNFFPDKAEIRLSCRNNSAPLTSMVNTCYKAAATRWPNFIDVDFYAKSDGAGPAGIVDVINGESLCGCNTVSSCKKNMTFGECEPPEPTNPPNPAGPHTKLSLGTYDSRPVEFYWIFNLLITTVVLEVLWHSFVFRSLKGYLLPIDSDFGSFIKRHTV